MTIDGLYGKTILVTGGTGSFGKTIVSKLLTTKVARIIVFSRDETKQYFMRQQLRDPRLSFYLGDVRDEISVNSAFQGVDFIFHAAALKQVPSCEEFPEEAVKTNVLGTRNVIHAALQNHCRRLVLLSTDKAVEPMNAMGMSKALAEKQILAYAARNENSQTSLCMTRYGNVLGSRGSVIPVFLERLNKKMPLEITDPKMTRFVMTLEESVDLVLYALSEGKNGDLFVQKAPSVTVEQIAKIMKKILRSDLENKIIGRRIGEKSHEVLLAAHEYAKASDEGAYYRVPLFATTKNSISNDVVNEYALTSQNTNKLEDDQLEKLIFDHVLNEESS